MAQVINKVRDVDPNNSEAVKDVLAAFFQNINKHAEIHYNVWLRALESIISRFPKYCMSHRNTIETYLVTFLSSNSYNTVIESAKCAHALQQVRPTQEKTATAKSCWRDQVTVLCKAAHALLSEIFSNAIDIYKGNESEPIQPQSSSPFIAALNEISSTKGLDKNINKKTLLCTRLRNVFVFLQAMLVEIYPVAKPIQPQCILEVIVRALSVTSDQNQHGDAISVIKIQALRTVDALIACLGANLIPFSALVTRFVMQTLRWSSDNTNEESSKVRCAAYSTLVRWLGILHAHRIANDGRGRSWEDELTKHITEDITPVKHIVQLTMSSQPTKNLSKKAKRKLANTMLQESSIASHMPGEKNKVPISEKINDDVAIAALECAETFLTVCGVFLKPTVHKLFQERLVRECYALETYSKERGLMLLRALEAARKAASPAVPPPTQYCLQLYSVLINSQQREISKFCTQSLLDIRLHLHCSPPSLNFALEVTEDRQKKGENKRKKMSERNRAALEALLGSENVPPVNNEEVITIQEEPSNKKPRLEDITDKISVSSESISSVEISDDSDEEVVIVIHADEKGNGSDESPVEEVDGIAEEKTNEPIEEIVSTDEVLVNTVSSIMELDANEVRNIPTTPPKTQVVEQPIAIVQPDDIEHTDQTISVNIFDAKTQMPLDISNDTEEDNIQLSSEIAYDLPNTAKEVPVLDKLEDENLPSTNDTDDIQITCGQKIKSSQDDEKSKDVEDKTEPKVNGIKSPEKPKDVVTVPESVTIKITMNNEEISVDDMLADFVDEVNDEKIDS